MKEKTFLVRGIKRTLRIVFSLTLLLVPVALQAQQVKISISNAQFTGPLLEALISKYHQEHPDVQFEIIKSGSADASVVLDKTENSETIGRFFVLPIANSENEILKDRKVQKGLNSDLARRIFVERNYLETLDAKDAGEQQLPGTVYSLTESKSPLTSFFADNLQVTSDQIKGKKILGSEENAITVVLHHPDAISFNVASLIYDQKNRLPVQGLTVLDVDIDHNDRISKEERTAIQNLDTLTAYLNHVKKTGIPIGTIDIKTRNTEVMQFVSWVTSKGQNLVNKMGYLKVDPNLTVQR